MGRITDGGSIWDMVSLEGDQNAEADAAVSVEEMDEESLFSQLTESVGTADAPEGTALQSAVREYLDNLILLGFMTHGLGGFSNARSRQARFLQQAHIGERLDLIRSKISYAADATVREWAGTLPTYEQITNNAGPFLRTQNLRKVAARLELAGFPGATDIDTARVAYAAIMFGDDISYSATVERKYGPSLNMEFGPMAYTGSESPLLLTFAGMGEEVIPRIGALPAFWRFYFAACHRDNLNDGGEYIGFIGGLSMPIDPIRMAMPFSYIPLPNIVAGLSTVAIAGSGIFGYDDLYSSTDMERLLSSQFFGGVVHFISGDDESINMLLSGRDGHCLSWSRPTEGPAWHSAVGRILMKVRCRTTSNLYRAGIFTLSARDPNNADNRYYAALEASADLFDTPSDLFAGGSGAKQAEAVDLMRQDKVERDAFDEVHSLHAKIAQKTAKERTSGEQTGDSRAATVIHYMERIPLSRGDEAVQETFAFRTAVAAIAENMDRNPDGVDASVRDSLRIWCNRWLFVTPVGVTKKLLQKLGIKLVLA